MSSSKPHVINQKWYYHCKDRLKQRYGLELTWHIYLHILFTIMAEQYAYEIAEKDCNYEKFHRHGFCCNKSADSSVWKISLLHYNTYIYCVYDHTQRQVITIFTKEMAIVKLKKVNYTWKLGERKR